LLERVSMPAGALTQRRGHRLRHVPYVESDHKTNDSAIDSIPSLVNGPQKASLPGMPGTITGRSYGGRDDLAPRPPWQR
jgi:hypothetical protein